MGTNHKYEYIPGTSNKAEICSGKKQTATINIVQTRDIKKNEITSNAAASLSLSVIGIAISKRRLGRV